MCLPDHRRRIGLDKPIACTPSHRHILINPVRKQKRRRVNIHLKGQYSKRWGNERKRFWNITVLYYAAGSFLLFGFKSLTELCVLSFPPSSTSLMGCQIHVPQQSAHSPSPHFLFFHSQSPEREVRCPRYLSSRSIVNIDRGPSVERAMPSVVCSAKRLIKESAWCPCYRGTHLLISSYLIVYYRSTSHRSRNQCCRRHGRCHTGISRTGFGWKRGMQRRTWRAWRSQGGWCRIWTSCRTLHFDD